MDFGRDLGRFFDDFSYAHGNQRFCSDCAQTTVLMGPNTLRKKRAQRKIYKNSMKNRCTFGIGQERVKNRTKIGFGRVLGSIWEGFGTVWGVSRALLGASWPFFGRSKTHCFKALVQDGLQEAPRSLLERFWRHLGRVLGGSWDGLGQFLNGF